MAPAAKREQMSAGDSGGRKGLRQDIKVELRGGGGPRAETRMAAVAAEKGKTKVRSKGPVKSNKHEKR